MAVPTLLVRPNLTQDRDGSITVTPAAGVTEVAGVYATRWRGNSGSELSLVSFPVKASYASATAWSAFVRARSDASVFAYLIRLGLVSFANQGAAAPGNGNAGVYFNGGSSIAVSSTIGAEESLGVVYDDGTYRIYRNGILMATAPTNLTYPSFPVTASASAGGAGNRYLEAVAMFDVALSDAEAKRITSMPSAWTWDSLQVSNSLPPRITLPFREPDIIVGTYATSCVLYRSDRYGRKLETLSDQRPITGMIRYSVDDEYQRSLALSIDEPDLLTPFKDFVIPEITIASPYGGVRSRDFGLFIVTPPTKGVRPGRRTGTIEAKDVTMLLARREIRNFTRPKGTDVGVVARDLILAAGFTANQIDIYTDTGVRLDEDYAPPPGTFTLPEVNELLAAGNCYAVGTTGEGILTGRRRQNLEAGKARTLYSNRQPGTLEVIPPIRETPNWDMLRNRVTVRRLQTDKPPIFGTARITNPNHPLYYDPNNPDAGDVGQEWTETVDNDSVPDNAAALALAQSILSERASYFREVNIATVVDIMAEAHDVVELDIWNGRQPLYTGNWYRDAWSIPIQGVPTIMEHQLRRTEKWS